MNKNTTTFPENYLKEDYIAKTDQYLNELEVNKKKDLYVKIGMSVFYVMLLVVSVIII
jgi:hypothetical protein